jgi:hypothetical protein
VRLIGSSVVPIAMGTILGFAVTRSVSGISLAMLGVVLMVVAIAGPVISLVWQAPRRRRTLCLTWRGDDVEPPRGDGSRLWAGRLALDRGQDAVADRQQG